MIVANCEGFYKWINLSLSKLLGIFELKEIFLMAIEMRCFERGEILTNCLKIIIKARLDPFF